MCEMASLFEKRLKCVGNDVDLWEMGKNIWQMPRICQKWLNYLTNGLNMWELT